VFRGLDALKFWDAIADVIAISILAVVAFAAYDRGCTPVSSNLHILTPCSYSPAQKFSDQGGRATAAIAVIWFRRKLRQVGEGALRRRARCLPTVAWLTSMPSLSSSPWMRGAPQSGLARLIRRIRARISALVLGRPGQRDRHRQ
jgi:hypothetical protein